ncbi:MAG TPA: glycosyltransferase [Candidatus Limnocylindrales bacterium]|nr:glycosyltransferase [Candidatus Limnocylindrales bacterium]
MTDERHAVDAAASDRPQLRALIVASWFPAYDDPAKGRFVADQVDALAASGAVRPSVLTFDPAKLSGGASSRDRQAAAVLAAGRAGVAAADPPFVAGVAGLHPSVGVARLTIPEGSTRSAGKAHAAVHRAAQLEAVADRLGGTPDGAGVVHAHTAYPDGAAAIALADRLGWPLFVTEHASFVANQLADPDIRAQYAAVVDRSAAFFAVSSMLADELRRGLPEHAERIQVLPNAVPVEQFRVIPLSARAPDELLFVGYWKVAKGIETLLRATALAHARRPSIRLRLVGRTADPDEERGWRELVDRLGIADAVSFESTRDRAGVAEAMARASIFVHPSRRETFGVVAVEALATGMPVVATDSGGVTEILGAEPDRLGALVPPDDPTSLAEAILATLDRRETFDPVALRDAVERRFGARFVAERLVLAYREALTGAAPPGRPLEAAPAKPTAPGPVVVITLDREQAAARLAPLPADLRSRITLVSAVEPRDRALPEVGRLVEVALETTWRVTAQRGSLRRRPGAIGRIARLVTDPVGTINRRRGRDAGAEGSLAPATKAVRRLATVTGATTVEVLAVDGHDHLAIESLVRDGVVRRSAGGLRRLADLDEAARRD